MTGATIALRCHQRQAVTGLVIKEVHLPGTAAETSRRWSTGCG